MKELDELDKQKALYQLMSKLHEAEVSKRSLKQITDAARGLGAFAEKGISVSSMYDVECDY